MKRKLIQLGPKTLLVSIPTKYVEKNNLKKGDEVEIIENKKELKISFQNKVEEKKCSFDMGNLERVGNRYIASAYRLGYDELTLKYSNSNYIKKLPQKLSNITIGMTIIKQEEKKCIIKDLSRLKKDELPNLINRSWYIILDMCKDINKFIFEDNYVELSTMDIREKSVNQFINYSLRLINLSGLSNSLYYFIRQIESISDSYRDIALYHSKNKIKSNNTINKLLKNTEMIVRELHENYLNFSAKKVNELINTCSEEITNIENDMLKLKNINLNIYYHYSLNIIKKIKELCSPLIEIKILNED
jgi:phosphate uptake regulator